jgi:histidine triad (HIT) family protein
MANRPGLTDYRGDDFYCDVAIPGADALEVVFEDEHILAFHHTRPYWKTHIVVVPRKHIASLTTVAKKDAKLMERLFTVVQSIARDVEQRSGAAAVLTNLGRYQDSKHLHVHVHSGGLRGA